MELVEVKTKGTKELNEVGVALKTIMVETKKALKDGWQPATDIPAISMASFAALAKAIEGLDKVGDEVRQYPVQAVMGALVPVAEGVGELVTKELESSGE